MPRGTKVATGNISPSRFVILATTADGKVTQASTGERVYGVSQPGTRNVPYSSLDDGYAAIAGENVTVFIAPETDVMLELGGTVTVGDLIKSDSNGKGVTADTDKDDYGARALASGTSGEIIPVQLLFGERSV